MSQQEGVRARREAAGDLGYLYDGRLILIRGVGHLRDKVRDLFFEQSEARGISGASYSPGRLVLEDRERDSRLGHLSACVSYTRDRGA
jgi:hypothetical protein